MKYENQILDAIEVIVDRAIDSAGYNKTIRGIISSLEDPTIGKYKIISMACNFLLDHTAPNYSKQLPVYKSFPCNFVQLGFQIPLLKFILTSFIFLFLRSICYPSQAI